MNLQNLSLWDVAIAALLIVVNGAASVALKLDLERKLAWAAVRTVVQLLAIGYVLAWVFAYNRWYVVLPLMIANMSAFALARHWRRTPVYEALLEQDGVHLPKEPRDPESEALEEETTA